ncbi:hypothetical protein B0G69_4093 [Paraburkholderia sp. RAU2J]|uniref:YciI family protein n=1 Tax=Paraburkholderia sp. RAU2J TaxID=1938810 RepID=UPI000F1BA82A|nr:YciI family protein [Paraburkholderia sp. RAU2J]RKT20759.1 hypothetical protein B0G69_4093 [Paraburkholderia sp. RAU2J]
MRSRLTVLAYLPARDSGLPVLRAHRATGLKPLVGGGWAVVNECRGAREEAEQFIAADPFSAVGLFERVTITRWRKAYFDGECCL